MPASARKNKSETLPATLTPKRCNLAVASSPVTGANVLSSRSLHAALRFSSAPSPCSSRAPTGSATTCAPARSSSRRSCSSTARTCSVDEQDLRLELLRSEEHTSELQSRREPLCRLLLEKTNPRRCQLP